MNLSPSLHARGIVADGNGLCLISNCPLILDKGKQFWCRTFKNWCKLRGIRPRHGHVGEPANIAPFERFIRSMKCECTRCLLVPVSLTSMRRELHLYTVWYNTESMHMGLVGKTPYEVWSGRARRQQRSSHDASGRTDLAASPAATDSRSTSVTSKVESICLLSTFVALPEPGRSETRVSMDSG